MRHRLAAAIRPTCLALALVLGVALPQAEARPYEYRIDPEHAAIGFLISHIGFAKTLGQFTEVEGSFVFDEEARSLSDVRVVVDTASVFTNHERRDEHVRNADFLDVDKHPTMTFVMTDYQAETQTTGKVTGDLTLLGVTRPLTLDVTLNKTGRYPFGARNYVVGVSARGSLNRSDFGMTYGVANGLVGDEVELILELEAIRQE